MNESDRVVIRADPKHKWIVFGLVLGVVALAAVGHLVARPFLSNWVSAYAEGLPDKSPEEMVSDYRLFSGLTASGLALPLVLLSVGFFYQGSRIRRSGRYPYPGMWLVRDTRLETGSEAGRRATRFVVLAGFLLIAGFAAGAISYSILASLLQSASSAR